jgi:hypothetical protein
MQIYLGCQDRNLVLKKKKKKAGFPFPGLSAACDKVIE